MELALIPGLGTVGGPELLIALVIILLLFGARRVPELMKGMGSGIREFRKGSRGEYDEVEDDKKQKKDGEISSEKDSSEDSDKTSGENDSRLKEDASASAEQEKRG